MKVEELVGDDLMMAYDGNYLSDNFGYSCANFNVNRELGFGTGSENTPNTFDFYTKNIKNISCIVAYDNDDKICGRRMFFKGKSLVNEEIFDAPLKRGQLVKYLYGYYGCRIRSVYNEINKYVLAKYRKGIIYMDDGVLKNGVIDEEIPNFFIMEVERSNYPIFPPIDRLFVCPEINALASFEPRQYMLETLEQDYEKENLEFHQAYRFSPEKRDFKKSYKTWLDNYKLDDKEDEVQEEDEN